MSTPAPEPTGSASVTPAQIAQLIGQQSGTAPPTMEPDLAAVPSVEAQEPQTVDSLPDWAQRHIRELRSESAKRRAGQDDAVAAAQQDLMNKIMSALGRGEEQTPKVDELTAQLTQAQTDARIADVTNRAIRAASAKGGIDIDGMLDSVTVTTKLAALDPGEATFDTDLASIIAEAASRYAVRSSSTGSTTGPPVTGQPPTGQLTIDDVNGMTPDEIATALNEGRLKGLL